MGGTYLGELANNIVELAKRFEEQRYPVISAVDCRYNNFDGQPKGLHIRDGSSRGLAVSLHSERRDGSTTDWNLGRVRILLSMSRIFSMELMG